ncbi:MAG: hypothetical protein IKO52_09900 [Clostridia bacterium]|nr:hypothetical protein [Clostridia bacterium]
MDQCKSLWGKPLFGGQRAVSPTPPSEKAIKGTGKSFSTCFPSFGKDFLMGWEHISPQRFALNLFFHSINKKSKSGGLAFFAHVGESIEKPLVIMFTYLLKT